MNAVMIVDDNENVIALLKEVILQHFPDFKIIEANDPVVGLSLFEKNRFQIQYLICDYLLPIQNGNDFIEIILEYNSNVKICIFTGDGTLTTAKLRNIDHLFYKDNGVEQIIEFLKK